MVRAGQACRNLRLQLFEEIRTRGGWLVGGLVGNIPQFAFAQDCQQRSRHHFFTVYFGPLQAMTQDPQVNILLFVRLSCGMGHGGTCRDMERHGGTLREVGTWEGSSLILVERSKDVSSHCALPR